MSIRCITDESHFKNELSAAGGNLVIVDFAAAWCRPCERVAPLYEILAAKYPKAVFLKVDVDKCQELAEKAGVKAMPSFFFYRNGCKIDCVEGADIDALCTKLVDHVENYKPHDNEYDSDEEDLKLKQAKPESSGSGEQEQEEDDYPLTRCLRDLNCFISKLGCECLNECDDHPMEHCLSSKNDSYLQSDSDEQLIMSISFNRPVKISGMYINAPADLGPREIKIFTNMTNVLDFATAESMPCVQELVLEPKDLTEGEPISLRFVKYQSVQNIQLFVRNNQAGVELTQIDYIGFIGTPIKPTNMTEFKRVAGKAGEAH